MHSKTVKLPSLAKSLSTKTIKIDAAKDQREEISAYFLQTYTLYEKIFQLIKDQQCFYTKSEPLRHPLIFYYGHTATFFVNKFLDAGILSQRINQKFEFMFAVGVDEMDWDDLNDTHYDWPKVQEVKRYRNEVKKMVLEKIAAMDPKISWQSNLWLVLMGIEHERIHLQTSAVIIRRIPIDKVSPIADFIECPLSRNVLKTIPKNHMVSVQQFKMNWRINRESANVYGWDNEFGNIEINLVPFEASQMLVSNGEYYQFIMEGGYETMQHWTEEGQAWLKATHIKMPLFWFSSQSGGGDQVYMLRTLASVREMPWDWPAEVNNLEAQAFCAWKSAKTGKYYHLPSQDQYYAIRHNLKSDQTNWYYQSVGNINLQYWSSPNPVDSFKTGQFYDVVGNVWQHTSTPFYPLENFQIHPLYEDFSTPTFDNRHNIIKGGSFISTGNLALLHSRYAFRRHFYQFAGFRYVISDNPAFKSNQEEQSDQKVEQALKQHYIEENSYIIKANKFIMDFLKDERCDRALSVGCSVGRIAFELADIFNESFGIDYTARFFQMATRLCESGKLSYRGVDVNFEKLGFKPNSVTLYQFNPQNPDPKKLKLFDFIFVDGCSLRPGTLMNALKKTQLLSLTSDKAQCKMAVVSIEGHNPLKKGEIRESFGKVWRKVFEEEIQSVNLQKNRQTQEASQKIMLTLFVVKDRL